MESEDSIPLNKILEIVEEHSALKNKVYASRVVVSFRVDTLSYSQMQQISMVPRFRLLEVSLGDQVVRVEIFRAQARKKRPRESNYCGVEQTFEFESAKEDKKLINKILSAFACVERDFTQFSHQICKIQEGYEVTLTKLDDMNFSQINEIVKNFKAYIRHLEFDFNGKFLRFRIQNISPEIKI